MSKRGKKGGWLIALGLLLIVSAGALTVYNMNTDWEAGEKSASVVSVLYEGIVAEQERAETLAEGKKPEDRPAQTGETASAQEESAGQPQTGGNKAKHFWKDRPKAVMDKPDYVLNPDMEMPEKEVDGNKFIGVLVVPALDLELPVLSEWSYPNLKVGPCRYWGSAYKNNMIVCGHNYDQHFGRLKELSQGDSILFTDVDGNLFTYEVAESETLRPRENRRLAEGDWDLTLYTCTVGGQTRFTLRCFRVQ